MFIVLEGIDGAGKGRQRNELIKNFDKQSIDYGTIDFPDHSGVLYKELIHPAIHNELDLSPKALMLSFILDQMLWQDRITPSKTSKDNHFIVDGYFTTTLVYQCILEEVFVLQDALELADRFEITMPDLNVFLDVDPEIAMQRKGLEEGHDEGLDRYEGNIEKQKKIRGGFLELANNNIFGEWAIIDGNGSIDEVRESILDRLNFVIN